MRLSTLAALLALAAPALEAQDTPSPAPITVFVVRHAEKGPEADDPSLTPAGAERAQALARTLTDVRPTALFTSEFRRTRETLIPLGKALGLEPSVVPAGRIDSLVGRIRMLPPGSRVVVASHSNLVHVIVQRLSGATVPELNDQDYDRLAVVTVTGPGRGTAVVLRYGTVSAAGARAPMKP